MEEKKNKNSKPRSKGIPVFWRLNKANGFFKCTEPNCKRNCQLLRNGSAPTTCLEDRPTIPCGGGGNFLMTSPNETIGKEIRSYISRSIFI